MDDQDWIEENADALFGPDEEPFQDPEDFADGDMFPTRRVDSMEPFQDPQDFADGDMFPTNRSAPTDSHSSRDEKDDDEAEGGAGVREPRRPLFPYGSGAVALDLPAA